MKKQLILIAIFCSLLFVSCTITDDDSNINFNNDGDVNILDNFKNLTKSDIEFIDSKVYEIQYKIVTVPSDMVETIYDINGDGEKTECFQYKLPGFNIIVDSVDHFISEDMNINLKIYAKLQTDYLVYEQDLSGTVFENKTLTEMFDSDVNTFVYILSITYKGELINNITMNLDVNGMLTARDWSDFND
ncbi:MAG TPA: hypothetical protein PLP48_06580 [Acholeplasmataceae bacterium]|mgnify:CR=1 FL=1|nr:hypothetical protein [Acholeplasmataceae bacterium]